MRLPIRLVSRALLLGALLLPCVQWVRPASAEPRPAIDRKLEGKIRDRLRKAGIAEGRYGVVVLERGSGRMLVLLGAAEPLVPASVAKVLTAASALDHLGPAYRFETVVEAAGALRDRVLLGDLVLRGGGDPSWDDLDPLEALARQVREAGIRRVTGHLVLSDGPLDREFTHADWTVEDKCRAYGAGVGGLSLGEGCMRVTVKGLFW